MREAPSEANQRGALRSPDTGSVKNGSDANADKNKDDRLNNVSGMESASPGCDLKCAVDDRNAEKRLHDVQLDTPEC